MIMDDGVDIYWNSDGPKLPKPWIIKFPRKFTKRRLNGV
jgi:hypothetical protein